MVANVGLDPQRDLEWVTDPKLKPLELFAAGKIDAFLGFPPEPQKLHERRAGHVILSTTADRPWSDYYCCMLAGNADFVRTHPITTKRCASLFAVHTAPWTRPRWVVSVEC
jgi:NitT/TauT family transport system substrate-binding protein